MQEVIMYTNKVWTNKVLTGYLGKSSRCYLLLHAIKTWHEDF